MAPRRRLTIVAAAVAAALFGVVCGALLYPAIASAWTITASCVNGQFVVSNPEPEPASTNVGTIPAYGTINVPGGVNTVTATWPSDTYPRSVTRPAGCYPPTTTTTTVAATTTTTEAPPSTTSSTTIPSTTVSTSSTDSPTSTSAPATTVTAPSSTSSVPSPTTTPQPSTTPSTPTTEAPSVSPNPPCIVRMPDDTLTTCDETPSTPGAPATPALAPTPPGSVGSPPATPSTLPATGPATDGLIPAACLVLGAGVVAWWLSRRRPA